MYRWLQHKITVLHLTPQAEFGLDQTHSTALTPGLCLKHTRVCVCVLCDGSLMYLVTRLPGTVHRNHRLTWTPKSCLLCLHSHQSNGRAAPSLQNFPGYLAGNLTWCLLPMGVKDERLATCGDVFDETFMWFLSQYTPPPDYMKVPLLALIIHKITYFVFIIKKPFNSTHLSDGAN